MTAPSVSRSYADDHFAKLAEAQERATHALAEASVAMNEWIREWAQWQFEFCATASDEQIAEADRLFGTGRLTELARELKGN